MPLLTRPDLHTKKGIKFSNQWLWSLEKRGLFPKRKYLGPLTPVWDEAEIDAWLEARLADYSDVKSIRQKVPA
jgi:predicted DNA-binding transcriptional regulator AlpA